MIEELSITHKDRINALGKTLSPTYDISKRGELERILVYTKQDEAIGFVQYSKIYETIDILYIVVDCHYRRLGIGRELIEHLERDLDVEHIMLEVRVTNAEAISFYEKLGFKKIRPIPNYYKNGEDALAMGKDIDRK